jgi:hypothetical protein
MKPLQNDRVLVLLAHLRIKWLFQLENDLYFLIPLSLLKHGHDKKLL